jgi:hypothetical protein
MNNRSVGFDTECDVFFQAATAANQRAVERLRARLMRHWLGCSARDYALALEHADGRLGAAIDALRAAGYDRLAPIDPKFLGPLASFIAAFHLGDPLGPADSFRPMLRRRRLAGEVAEVAARTREAADTQ